MRQLPDKVETAIDAASRQRFNAEKDAGYSTVRRTINRVLAICVGPRRV